MSLGIVTRVTKIHDKKYAVPLTCQEIDIIQWVRSKFCTNGPHTLMLTISNNF